MTPPTDGFDASESGEEFDAAYWPDEPTHAPPPLTAGRELNALVAEKVMGLEYHDEDGTWRAAGHLCCLDVELPNYSTDIGAAWLVVEKLNGMNATVEITDTNHDPAIWVEVWGLNAIGMETQLARVGDVTAPLAICRAALAAVECA